MTHHSDTRFRLVSVAVLILGGFYLLWRAAFSFNPAAFKLSLFLFCLESLSYFNLILFTICTWKLDANKDARRQNRVSTFAKSVDIFIATYNEDIETLEPTIVGAKLVRGRTKIYVLDDGNRESIRALAASHDIFYISRSANTHAKAGNINNALGQTNGEFIVTLDADFVPQPDLLELALPFFDRPNLAGVQFPQDFYNLDSIQHVDSMFRKRPWHEQEFFYRILLPGRNYFGTAFWCGTPAVLRRTALESAGGVGIKTVVEDYETSLNMMQRGWVIHSSPLSVAYGLSPQTMKAFVVQRNRWCKGNSQVLALPDGPLRQNFFQRGVLKSLSLFAGHYYYLTTFTRSSFMLLPLMSFALGASPIKADFKVFLAFWSVYFYCVSVLMSVRSRGFYRIVDSDAVSIMQLFSLPTSAIAGFLPRKGIFNVTPKNEDPRSAFASNLGYLKGITLILILNIYVISITLSRTSRWENFSFNERGFIIFGIAWLFYNTLLITYVIQSILDKHYPFRIYRFPAIVSVDIETSAGSFLGTTIDLSSNGSRIRLFTKSSQPVTFSTILVHLPGSSIKIDVKVMWQKYEVKQKFFVYGVEFISLSKSDRESLLKFLYVDLPATRPNKAKPFVYLRGVSV